MSRQPGERRGCAGSVTNTAVYLGNSPAQMQEKSHFKCPSASSCVAVEGMSHLQAVVHGTSEEPHTQVKAAGSTSMDSTLQKH